MATPLNDALSKYEAKRSGTPVSVATAFSGESCHAVALEFARESLRELADGASAAALAEAAYACGRLSEGDKAVQLCRAVALYPRVSEARQACILREAARKIGAHESVGRVSSTALRVADHVRGAGTIAMHSALSNHLGMAMRLATKLPVEGFSTPEDARAIGKKAQTRVAFIFPEQEDPPDDVDGTILLVDRDGGVRLVREGPSAGEGAAPAPLNKNKNANICDPVPSHGAGSTKRARGKIVLNMIVRNERKVLPRLFRSLKDVIDAYVIVDTGSTDGTQGLVRSILSGDYGIPGEVHERKWVDFCTARQQALDLAVESGLGEWALIIDADEELVTDDASGPHPLHGLVSGCTYRMYRQLGNIRYSAMALMNILDSSWTWRGRVHNYAHAHGPVVLSSLSGVHILSHIDEGAKSHGVTRRQKYMRDAGILREDLAARPGDPRAQYYLGQSLAAAGEHESALVELRKRAKMRSGDPQERFLSRLVAAKTMKLLEMPDDDVTLEFARAVEEDPGRKEGWDALANHMAGLGKPRSALVAARAATACANGGWDTMFQHTNLLDWDMRINVASLEFAAQNFDAARDVAKEALALFTASPSFTDGENYDAAGHLRIVRTLGCALRRTDPPLADPRISSADRVLLEELVRAIRRVGDVPTVVTPGRAYAPLPVVEAAEEETRKRMRFDFERHGAGPCITVAQCGDSFNWEHPEGSTLILCGVKSALDAKRVRQEAPSGAAFRLVASHCSTLAVLEF